MASRGNRAREEKKSAAEYYELKTKAVDDLVNANVSNSPEVSRAELRKYRRHGKFYIPEPVKYFFVKWWFAGVVCWFLVIGLAGYAIANLDRVVITGVAYGMLMHALVNGYLRMKAETEGANDGWAIFPKTGLPWMFANIAYGIALCFLAFATYWWLGLNEAIGPILFGTFVAAWDGLFILFKRLFLRILADAKKNAG